MELQAQQCACSNDH